MNLINFMIPIWKKKATKVLKTTKLTLLFYILYTYLLHSHTNIYTEIVYKNINCFLWFDLIDVPFHFVFADPGKRMTKSIGALIHHMYIIYNSNFLQRISPTIGMSNIYTLILYRLVANIPIQIHHTYAKIILFLAFAPQALYPAFIYTLHLPIVASSMYLTFLLYMELLVSLGVILQIGLFLAKMLKDVTLHISYKDKNNDYIMQVLY